MQILLFIKRPLPQILFYFSRNIIQRLYCPPNSICLTSPNLLLLIYVVLCIAFASFHPTYSSAFHLPHFTQPTPPYLCCPPHYICLIPPNLLLLIYIFLRIEFASFHPTYSSAFHFPHSTQPTPPYLCCPPHCICLIPLEHIGLVVRMSILDTEVDGSNPSISYHMFFP